jgi:hypothetical protein
MDAHPGGPETVAVVLVAASIVALMVGLGWGVMTYTATPSFCNSCHVMNTRFVSWQRSPHGDVATCLECHSEPGWWGELKAHVNGARYLYVMVTGEKTRSQRVSSGYPVEGRSLLNPASFRRATAEGVARLALRLPIHSLTERSDPAPLVAWPILPFLPYLFA